MGKYRKSNNWQFEPIAVLALVLAWKAEASAPCRSVEGFWEDWWSSNTWDFGLIMFELGCGAGNGRGASAYEPSKMHNYASIKVKFLVHNDELCGGDRARLPLS